MPDADRPQNHSPNPDAQAELHTCDERVVVYRETDEESSEIIDRPLSEVDPNPNETAFQVLVKAIRHQILGISLIQFSPFECGIDVIEPGHVAPKECGQGAMRIFLLVGMLVMPAMHGDPTGRRVLQAANAEDCQEMFQPF